LLATDKLYLGGLIGTWQVFEMRRSCATRQVLLPSLRSANARWTLSSFSRDNLGSNFCRQ